MNSNTTKYFRLLAISPSTYGFGFFVLEASDVHVDSGAKSVRKGNKNDWCVGQAEKLLGKYQPHAMVLYDHAKNLRRSDRIRELNQRLAGLAKIHKIPVKLLSREHVELALIPDGTATKHKIATMLAERAPDELASKLPRKRREWDSEFRQMDVFDAMALAVAFRHRSNKQKRKAS